MSTELVLLGEILGLASDSSCNLGTFGEKVATSPRLEAEVVRVSNSALYGLEGKINRLERAVLILGMRTVADIASALLVAAKMKNKDVGKLRGDAIWMHSLEIGVCAQLVAHSLGLPLESEAYPAGLLHDLGILEMHEAHGAPYAELVANCQRKGSSLVEAEQESYGETHASRLLSAAANWGFPETLREAIGYHDTPSEAPEASRTLAMLVRNAHAIVEEPIEGWSDVPRSEGDAGAFSQLELLPEGVDDIRELLRKRLKELAPLFA